MSRFAYLILPLALTAVVFAQETEKPADLVKQLGHDDYEVREAATKKLVALGQAAVPELEKALKADDLEVRLRAGRALRSIRAKQGSHAPVRQEPDGPKAEGRTTTPVPEGRVVATEMSILDGKVKLKVTRLVGGKRVVKSYEAKSVDELKQGYPELREVLGNFRVQTRDLRDKDFRFDMERFWKDFGREFNKDFWRAWQKDIEKESARLRKLTERWRKQWGQEPGQRASPFGFAVPRGESAPGGKLGAAASWPSRVLAAQLGLRGRGVVLERILQGSLAERLGLERYDVLVELNGVPIRNYSDIGAALKNHADGDTVTAKVIRRAKQTALSTKR